MDIVTEKRQRNYLSYDVETKIAVVRRMNDSGWSAKRVKSYYRISRTSAWRWRKKYDGTPASLENKSHRPRRPHPKTTSERAKYKIACYRKRNPNDSSVDIWAKTVKSGFPISYSTCLRILKKSDGYEPYKTNPKKRHNKEYHTPEVPGEKWQIDVKFVPTECKAPGLEGRFYQYTFLDEATRKRYLHFSNEHSMYQTVVGLRKAIEFFGYAPKVIQTDNGSEFTDRGLTKREDSAATRDWPCLLDSFCAKNSIVHKCIKPRTPEHNGKVERSHRIDQEKFYRTLLFHSLSDLAQQGARWMRRYNGMPRMALNMKSPNEVELEKLAKLMHDTGEVRCPKLLKRFTSSAN